MTGPPSKLRLPGLTRLEALELKEVLDPDLFSMTEHEPTSTEHRELIMTTVVVIFSIAAIKAIAAWLLKKRKYTSFSQTLEVIRPDGTVEKRTLTFEKNESESPEEQVLKQLSDMFKIDLAKLERSEE